MKRFRYRWPNRSRIKFLPDGSTKLLVWYYGIFQGEKHEYFSPSKSIAKGFTYHITDGRHIKDPEWIAWARACNVLQYKAYLSDAKKRNVVPIPLDAACV